MFDEGAGDDVAVGDQQLLEGVGILEGASVRQFAGGLDLGVGADSGRDLLLRTPLTDGVVVIPGEAERIDLRVAGRAVRVRGVGGQLIA